MATRRLEKTSLRKVRLLQRKRYATRKLVRWARDGSSMLKAGCFAIVGLVESLEMSATQGEPLVRELLGHIDKVFEQLNEAYPQLKADLDELSNPRRAPIDAEFEDEADGSEQPDTNAPEAAADEWKAKAERLQLLLCVQCGKPVGAGCRTDSLAELADWECHCDDPSLEALTPPQLVREVQQLRETVRLMYDGTKDDSLVQLLVTRHPRLVRQGWRVKYW